MNWKDRVNRFAKPPAVSRQLVRARPPSDRVQLRRDPSAGFVFDRKGWGFTKRTFFVGSGRSPVLIPEDRLQDARRIQAEFPYPVARAGDRKWWWFEGQFYWENGHFDARDVLALIRQRQKQAQSRLDRAHLELELEMRPGPQRGPVPKDLRLAVFERDGGTCVECGSNFDLQYDHIIPVALGGATNFDNLQLLCSSCNQRKGKSL